MAWPIILTAKQSDAVRSATRDFLKTLEGEERGMFAIVLSQMDRGISLDLEEQEMVKGMLLKACRAGGPPELETAFFKLYGVWPVNPPYWQIERDEKAARRASRDT